MGIYTGRLGITMNLEKQQTNQLSQIGWFVDIFYRPQRRRPIRARRR